MKKYILMLSLMFCFQVTFKDENHNKIKGIIVQNLPLNSYLIEAWDGQYYNVSLKQIIRIRKVHCR